MDKTIGTRTKLLLCEFFVTNYGRRFFKIYAESKWLSSKRGDSFEARTAHILRSAGFVIKEQPHIVRYQGKNIGDLDVLAEDPNTGILIGVSCKEWFNTTPGSQEFSHFVEMLEFENLKHGIFASATTISDVIPPRLEYVRNQKGMNVFLLDYDTIKNLESWAYAREDWQVEDYVRSQLRLPANKRTTIGDEIRARKSAALGKTIECDKLIPVNYYDEPPDYIANRDFVASESTLSLEPYLVVDYNLHVEARHPGTNAVLEDRTDAGIIVVDAVKGKFIDYKSSLYKHIEKYYTNAETHVRIQEKGFVVRKTDPSINDREYVYMIRDQIAARNEIRTEYTTARDETKPLIKRPRSDDVRILGKYIIYVPIWNVTFNLGARSYRRIYFAYDGEGIEDEMTHCSLCKNNTIAICTECYATTCDNHSRACKSCKKILCDECAKICVDCDTSFCKEHKPETSCGICKSLLCSNCSTISCKECSLLTCSKHREKCVECHSFVCDKHFTSRRFGLATKNFCSQACLTSFHEEYKASNALGKVKKWFKK